MAIIIVGHQDGRRIAIGNPVKRLIGRQGPGPQDAGCVIVKEGQQADSNSGGHRPVYTTQKGQTVFEIARDELGQASRYVEILELNKQLTGVDIELE